MVGLTQKLLGADTPNMSRLARNGGLRNMRTVTPAVTCTVQSTLVTGAMPSHHGCVGNGWYYRDLSEIWFWRQSNKLVQGEKLWETASKLDASFTCAKLFWWYNMYSSADWSITPRPMYLADGRKIPDIYAEPASLRDELSQSLGQFPLFKFWGPGADISSSAWIGKSALDVEARYTPTLNLVYLPHLDYGLQKYGPDANLLAPDLRAIDSICGDLIEQAERDGVQIVLLSEYGITEVSGPIFINRILRESGLLRVREELGKELLDAGASEAFAVCDHQVAHIYIRHPENINVVKEILAAVDGIESVLDDEGKTAFGLNHDRSGELVAISTADRWFAYYHWFDDNRAMDYARTVEIHRKPGYDPVELFMDPSIKLPALTIASKLVKKMMGFRVLMDVIPLDATLVRGSHGRVTDRAEDGPLVISSRPDLLPDDDLHAVDVKKLILEHIFEDLGSRYESLKE